MIYSFLWRELHFGPRHFFIYLHIPYSTHDFPDAVVRGTDLSYFVMASKWIWKLHLGARPLCLNHGQWNKLNFFLGSIVCMEVYYPWLGRLMEPGHQCLRISTTCFFLTWKVLFAAKCSTIAFDPRILYRIHIWEGDILQAIHLETFL